MCRNFFGSFHDWEIAIARKLVSDHMREWECLRQVDYEDLVWECVSHWYMVKNTYDERKNASRQTYMGRIIQNKLQDIIRKQTTDKRKIWHHTISLEEKIDDEKDSPTLLDQLDADLATETYRNPSESLDLRIDLENAKMNLNPKQRKICDMLMKDHSITDISKILATPRSTIYDEIKRISRIFEDGGLANYFR